MSEKISAAVQRLAGILPLQKNLAGLDASSRSIYHAIQHSFLTQGRAPTLAELNAVSAQAIDALRLLCDQDMIVSNAQGEVTGAYPFTSAARTSRVEINGHTVYAMCALDALAPAAMAQGKSRVISACAVTQAEVVVELDDQTILHTDASRDLFVGINWQAASSASSCAASLCTEMLFLKGNAVALQWQAGNAEFREIFTLAEAVQFAAAFFVPLLSSSD